MLSWRIWFPFARKIVVVLMPVFGVADGGAISTAVIDGAGRDWVGRGILGREDFANGIFGWVGIDGFFGDGAER